MSRDIDVAIARDVLGLEFEPLINPHGKLVAYKKDGETWFPPRFSSDADLALQLLGDIKEEDDISIVMSWSTGHKFEVSISKFRSNEGWFGVSDIPAMAICQAILRYKRSCNEA